MLSKSSFSFLLRDVFPNLLYLRSGKSSAEWPHYSFSEPSLTQNSHYRHQSAHWPGAISLSLFYSSPSSRYCELGAFTPSCVHSVPLRRDLIWQLSFHLKPGSYSLSFSSLSSLIPIYFPFSTHSFPSILLNPVKSVLVALPTLIKAVGCLHKLTLFSFFSQTTALTW